MAQVAGDKSAPPAAPAPTEALPKQSYIICTTPRTGSYLLCEALRHTGVAGVPNEYLSGGYRHYWEPRWGTRDYPAFLRRITRVGTTPNGVFGAKVHSIQFEYFLRQITGAPDLPVRERRDVLERWFPNPQYIWLRREDHMRQAISYTRALQTRIWWDADRPPAPYDAPRPDALRFDRSLIERSLAQLREGDRSWELYFEAHGIEPLELTYETMVDDMLGTVARVTEFLNLELPGDFSVPPSQFRRQSDSVTDEWLERYLAGGPAKPATANGGGPRRMASKAHEAADSTRLDHVLASRRWWVCTTPFRHIRARQVFVPAIYNAMAAEFRHRLQQSRFARNMPGYDASAMSVTAAEPGAFWPWLLPAWRALWSRLLAPDSSNELNVTLHHHDAGSLSGAPHNDLNPGWFIDERSPSATTVADPRVCSYTSGETDGQHPVVERVRSVALIYYLANPDGYAGSGGETGLYERASDPVERPVIAVPPVNNSLVAFECTPYSFHSFITNPYVERNCLVMWLHRPKDAVVRRWGSDSIVGW